MTVYLERLNLYNYRNFKELNLVFDNNIIIILGENGSGKTNILESISLLSPGKGLKGAKYEEMAYNSSGGWSSSIYFKSKIGKALVESNYVLNNNLRTIEYNGSKIRNTELIALANIIWLTPQMDGIFLSSPSEQRKFLDRIVYNFYQEHASNINKYDHLVRERLKLLMQNNSNFHDSWLKILETKIADIALEIIKLRSNVINFVQEYIDMVDTPFPKAQLAVNHLFSKAVGDEEFLETYLTGLSKNRQKDKITKRTNLGINKQELIVKHKEKDQFAKFCSTGEQKALLISILIGQIEANKAIAKTTPILLLDELFVHLDDKRKDCLAQYIINSKLQTFVTATDMAGLERIAAVGQIIYV